MDKNDRWWSFYSSHSNHADGWYESISTKWYSIPVAIIMTVKKPKSTNLSDAMRKDDHKRLITTMFSKLVAISFMFQPDIAL